MELAATGAPEWSRLLRNGREKLGLSRAETSRQARIAASTLRSYEIGARHPSRDRLIAILDALQMDLNARSGILASAGYAPEAVHHTFGASVYSFTVDEARSYIEGQTWPATVIDENLDFVCANAAARNLWGIEPGRQFPNPDRRSMFAAASTSLFGGRVRNLDEAIRVGIAGLKGHPPRARDIARGHPGPLRRYSQALLRGQPSARRTFHGTLE